MKKLRCDKIKVFEVFHAVAHLDGTFHHHTEMRHLTNL